MPTVIVPLVLSHRPGDPSPSANLRDAGWDIRDGEWPLGRVLVGERREDGALVSLYLGGMGQAVIMASGTAMPSRRAVMGVYRMYAGQQDPVWQAASGFDSFEFAGDAGSMRPHARTELACAAFLARCAKLLRANRLALIRRGFTPRNVGDFVERGLLPAGWLECVDWMGSDYGILDSAAVDAERTAFARIAAYAAAVTHPSPLHNAVAAVSDVAVSRLAGGA